MYLYYTNIKFQQDYALQAMSFTLTFCKKNSLKVFCIVGLFIYAFIHTSQNSVVSSPVPTAPVSTRVAYIAEAESSKVSRLGLGEVIGSLKERLSHQPSLKPYINTSIQLKNQLDIDSNLPIQADITPVLEVQTNLIRPQQEDSFFAFSTVNSLTDPNQNQNFNPPIEVEIGYNKLWNPSVTNTKFYSIKKSTSLSYTKHQGAHKFILTHKSFSNPTVEECNGWKVGYHYDPNGRSCWTAAFQVSTTNQIHFLTQNSSPRFVGQGLNVASATNSNHEAVLDEVNRRLRQLSGQGEIQAEPENPAPAEQQIRNLRAHTNGGKVQIFNRTTKNNVFVQTSPSKSITLAEQKQKNRDKLFRNLVRLAVVVYAMKQLNSISDRPDTSIQTKNLTNVGKIFCFTLGAAAVYDGTHCAAMLGKDYVETNGLKFVLNQYYNWQRDTKMKALEQSILSSVLCSLRFAWLETFVPGLAVTLLILLLRAGLNSGDKGDNDYKDESGSPNQPKPNDPQDGPHDNRALVEVTPDAPVGKVSNEGVNFDGSEKPAEKSKKLRVSKLKFSPKLAIQWFKGNFKKPFRI